MFQKVHGAPIDERNMSQPSTKLKNIKLQLKVVCPDHSDKEDIQKTFMPTTRVAKIKMMLKRALKIDSTATIKLSYWPSKVSN